MGNTSNAFTKFFTNSIPKFFRRSWKWLKDEIISPVYGVVVDMFAGARDLIVKTEDTAAGVVNNAVDKITDTATNLGADVADVASSLKLPLIAGAAAIAIFMIMKPNR